MEKKKEEPKQKLAPIKYKTSKIEKTLKLSNDEIIARAISDLLKRDEI
ncbi:MAG: hypothetical protein IJ736_00545 [Firmicutes bacterium]|nr:hypothetical protein [Bacillota bacterium]